MISMFMMFIMTVKTEMRHDVMMERYWAYQCALERNCENARDSCDATEFDIHGNVGESFK